MDELRKAKRKWKRAEGAVEDAEARLKAARGKRQRNDSAGTELAAAQRELEEAGNDERKARRKFKKLKREQEA